MIWFFAILWLLFLAILELFTLAMVTSRDFGAFVILHVIGPAPYILVVVIHLAAGVLALLERRSIARVAFLVTGLLTLGMAPAFVRYAPELLKSSESADLARWLRKYDAQLDRLTSRPAVLVHWEAWGMAGMSWDSYLVSDPEDQLDDAQHITEFGKGLRLDCSIGGATRIHRKVFLIEIYNCPIDNRIVQNYR